MSLGVCVCVCVYCGDGQNKEPWKLGRVLPGSVCVCVCVCVCVVGDGQNKEPWQLGRVLPGRGKAAGRRLSFFEKSRD